MTEPTGSGADRVEQPSRAEPGTPEGGIAPVGDGAAGGQPRADAPVAGADLGRRRFFRAFASEVFGAAAQVVGVATALQQSSAEAAGALLDPQGAAARAATWRAPAAPVFRTAFRWEGDRVIVVDHRRLPEAVVEVEARTAAEVAQLIRDRVVTGAPLLGQVAAVGLALTADRVRQNQVFARRAVIRGSATALANSSPASITVKAAVERMLDRYVSAGELTAEGPDIAAALLAEAEAIVGEATAAHGRIAELAAAELRALSAGRPGVGEPEAIGQGQRSVMAEQTIPPLRILTLGATGVLAGGQFGTALSAITTAVHGGLAIHVTIAETRPLLEGSRLDAWELAQAGVGHTVMTDSGVAGLLARGSFDIVLVGADRIAANGDLLGIVGTYPIAAVAARHGVPVVVCAPLACVDLRSATAAEFPLAEGPAADVLRFGDQLVAPADSPAANPLLDATPAELVSAIVTEAGVLRPPFAPGLNAAVERLRGRGHAESA